MSLVTAAITTHKRKPEIVERALKSILNQTYKNIEIFVVDDSPSDWEYRNDVKTMVESYSSQNVTYIPHEKCMGACVARNTALEVANGEYIGYLDDDDEWKPKKIEKQLNGFIDDEIALVYCGYEVINDVLKTSNVVMTQKVEENICENLLIKNFVGSTSFPLIKTECLRNIGGFDPLMQSAQDIDVWIRLCEKYKINCVEEALIAYHFHEGEQITTNPKKKINGAERLNEKNMKYLLKNKEAYWKRTAGFIPFYVLDKKYKKAFSLWFKGCCKCPLKFVDNSKNLYCIIMGLIRRK